MRIKAFLRKKWDVGLASIVLTLTLLALYISMFLFQILLLVSVAVVSVLGVECTHICPKIVHELMSAFTHPFGWENGESGYGNQAQVGCSLF